MAEEYPLLARAFGQGLARDVERYCRIRPALVRQLAFYNVRQIHAVVAWMLLAPQPEGDDLIAERLLWTSPRDLLRQALPDHTPELLWKALNHFRLMSLPHEAAYSRLAALMRGPAAPAILHGGAFSHSDLGFYEKLADLIPTEPLLLPAATALRADRRNLDAACSALALLRAHSVLGPEANEAAALRRLTSAEGLSKFLLRRLGQVGLAVPPLAPDSALHPIRSVKALREVGHRFENCLGRSYHLRYIIEALQGSQAFYEWKGSTPAVVCLDIVGPNLVSISEMAGHANGELDEAVQAEIVAELERSGLRVLPGGLSSILRQFRDDSDPDFDDIDDIETLFDDHGETEFASAA